MCRDDTSSYWYISGAFCLVSRGWFELLYSVFNECSEELIVKSNFMFFFLYCVVFLLGSICFLSLSFCQNVRFRPLCLPYSSVVPALMDFIRFSRGGGFYRFARVGAAFAFLLPCAGFGCAPAVLRRVR